MDAPENDGNATMPEQVKRPNPCRKIIIIIIVLGRHVSILTESSSGPSKVIDPHIKCLKYAVGSQTLTLLIKLCIKCMCGFVLIVQSRYLFLKLSPVHMKEVTLIYIQHNRQPEWV